MTAARRERSTQFRCAIEIAHPVEYKSGDRNGAIVVRAALEPVKNAFRVAATCGRQLEHDSAPLRIEYRRTAKSRCAVQRARAVGEERAWGRRLARRFGVDSNYDEQTFVVKSNGQSGFIDHESLRVDKISAAVAELFVGVNAAKGGSLIVHGWTMAEDLVKLGSRQHT